MNPNNTDENHGEDALLEGLTDELDNKHRRFVEEYCVDFNARQAAIRAGYSEHSAKHLGYRLRKNPAIALAIQLRMEDLAMSAEEAAVRLTRMGRGSIEPSLSPEGGLNLTSDAAQENLYLIKKVKTTKRVERVDGVPVADIISTEIELHDAKDAIDKMLQYHGKYVKKHEHSGPGGTPIQVEDLTQLSDDELRTRISRLGGRAVPAPTGAQ